MKKNRNSTKSSKHHIFEIIVQKNNSTEQKCFHAYTEFPIYRCNCAGETPNQTCLQHKQLFEKENPCIQGKVDVFQPSEWIEAQDEIDMGGQSTWSSIIPIGIGVFIGSALLVILSAYAYAKLKTKDSGVTLIGPWDRVIKMVEIWVSLNRNLEVGW